LFRNQTIVWAGSKESYGQESDYTGHAICFWFTKKGRIIKVMGRGSKVLSRAWTLVTFDQSQFKHTRGLIYE